MLTPINRATERELFAEINFGCFLAGALLTWLLNKLALIPWRRSEGKHWTERARRLYPVRTAAAFNLYLIPSSCLLASSSFGTMPDQLWVLPALAAFGGAVLGSYPFDRAIFPSLRFGEWLKYVSAAWALRFSLWMVLIVAGVVMPEEIDFRMAWVGFGVLIFHLWLNWGMWIWLARQLRLVSAPPERLERIVSAAARQLGVPIRGVWLLAGPYAYAAALPTTRDLIFSRHLLEPLSDDEIATICAHELGHLTESRLTLAGRLVGSLVVFPWIFVRPVVHAYDFGGIALLTGISGVVLVFSRRLGRKMEVRADRMAVGADGQTGNYARALEKLYQANQTPAVMPGDRMIHPHLYDRLLAAGMTPDYPRPSAPKKLGWPAVLMASVLGILIVRAFLLQ